MSVVRTFVIPLLLLSAVVAVAIMARPGSDPGGRKPAATAIERPRPIESRGGPFLRGQRPGAAEEGLEERSDDETAGATEPPGAADEPTADEFLVRIRQLLTDYRAVPAGPSRQDIVRQLARANRQYAKVTNDLQFVPAIRDIMNDSEDRTERKLAAIGLQRIEASDPQGLVIGILETGTESEDHAVRFYCAEGLCWVRGAHAARAREKLVGLLRHEDPEVREVSALVMATIVRDARSTDALLEQLEVESADAVLYALVRGVLTLDPVAGRSRIAAARTDRSIEGVVERAEADLARSATASVRTR